MDQARRRDAFGVFHEAAERAEKLRQALRFLAPDVGDHARLRAMRDLKAHSSLHRASSQSFSAASGGKLGVGRQSR